MAVEHDDLNTVIRRHSEWLANQLHSQRESLFPPNAQKSMRKFTSGEAAALLGVNDSYLRKLHLDGKGPSPVLTPGNRRQYSAENIQELRVLLEKTARKPGDYLPGRREGDHLQVVGVMNFKGGSGKTTTSAHLAQRLALKGYRGRLRIHVKTGHKGILKGRSGGTRGLGLSSMSRSYFPKRRMCFLM